MTVELQIQRLQDRVDILETLYRYCRTGDARDLHGKADTFTKDCVVSFVPDGLGSVLYGREQVLQFFITLYETVISGSHHISNAELFFDKPDAVTAHAYMYSWQRFQGFPQTADCHRWGRYELAFVRIPEGWRISRLKLLSAGEYGGARIGEQIGRPCPPALT